MFLFVSQVCDTPDEAYPARSSQRNLHQAAGGGEREEGQLRARGLFTMSLSYLFHETANGLDTQMLGAVLKVGRVILEEDCR